jgi:hypothetical protein
MATMKPFFTYLILVILFVAGTRLVNRQQKYTRSIQELSLVETTALAGRLDTNEPNIQPLQLALKPFHNVAASATDTSLLVSTSPKQDLAELTGDKK